MAPTAKTTEIRRRSGSKPGLVVTLTIPSARLRDIIKSESVEDDQTVKETEEDSKASPAPSGTPAEQPNSTGENASDSNEATPAAEGTPADSIVVPAAEGGKKKGVKRSAAAANGSGDSTPKPRGKPGPKKKPRLEDGTIDHANTKGVGHKLGPKANQGAINAGLRALDRSGKPCRKWARGGFTLKSFTGVVWEIPRWTAPKRMDLAEDDSATASAAASAEAGSSKENKENAAEANSGSNSNNGVDVEMQSAPDLNGASPAPIAIAAAS
ncbi:INO80 complex, subunit Ies4 [Stachybotrys elegans]|uniref:INO80 complex, subunit Ies4 n=1 Tax=Stachybotrys elegans TaxID=80388 RepID=A0A8K0WV99_9HYPO|nr:INO80 complex, subunit Ies4 [Stachybotrys elegans]